MKTKDSHLSIQAKPVPHQADEPFALLDITEANVHGATTICDFQAVGKDIELSALICVLAEPSEKRDLILWELTHLH
eukprot:4498006-Karenia_brevis.AAC.1